MGDRRDFYSDFARSFLTYFGVHIWGIYRRYVPIGTSAEESKYVEVELESGTN